MSIFTYSVGESASLDGGLGKSIACATGGIWAAIPDGAAMADALSGYYAFYAAAIAPATTHVIWTEPYTYTSGALGVTVVSPAFDRTGEGIPVLIGVIGMDFSIDAMEDVMGGGISARASVLDTLAQRATSSCPAMSLSECDLQSLRRASGLRFNAGANAMCAEQCSTTTAIASTAACLAPSLYPPEDGEPNT